MRKGGRHSEDNFGFRCRVGSGKSGHCSKDLNVSEWNQVKNVVNPSKKKRVAYRKRSATGPMVVSSSSSSSLLRLLFDLLSTSVTSSFEILLPIHSSILLTNANISCPVLLTMQIGKTDFNLEKVQYWSSRTKSSKTRVDASQGINTEWEDLNVASMTSSNSEAEIRKTLKGWHASNLDLTEQNRITIFSSGGYH